MRTCSECSKHLETCDPCEDYCKGFKPMYKEQFELNKEFTETQNKLNQLRKNNQITSPLYDELLTKLSKLARKKLKTLPHNKLLTGVACTN